MKRDLPGLLLLLLAFSPTMVWIVQGWLEPESYFAHGPLLVLLCLWALREKHRKYGFSRLGGWAACARTLGHQRG